MMEYYEVDQTEGASNCQNYTRGKGAFELTIKTFKVFPKGGNVIKSPVSTDGDENAPSGGIDLILQNWLNYQSLRKFVDRIASLVGTKGYICSVHPSLQSHGLTKISYVVVPNFL